MENRRHQGQLPKFGGARILVDFAEPISCALMERSKSGARLKVISILGIPDRFLLQIGQEHIPSRVAWRSPAEIGVSFEVA